MAGNLIINGTFDDQQFEPWERRPDSEWKPTFFHRSTKPTNWAIEAVSEEYFIQDLAPSTVLQGEHLSISVEARAAEGRSIVSVAVTGLDRDGAIVAFPLYDLAESVWTPIKGRFPLDGRIIKDVSIRVTALHLESLRPRKNKQNGVLTFIDNLTLEVYP